MTRNPFCLPFRHRPGTWAGGGGLLVLLVAGPGCAPSATPRTPVVLIVVDTLRADHLTQYGYDRNTSGALDAFAAAATRFDRCHAPAPWTTPSTASIFTGLLPAHHGADFRGAGLPDEATSLAECLQAGGWTTLGISANYCVTAATSFDQGFDYFEDFAGESGEYPDIGRMPPRLRFLVRTAPRPFFLYVQPMNVHGPYRTPEAHQADLLGRPPGSEFRYGKSPMKAIMKKGDLARRAEVDEAYRASHRDQYDTAVRYSMDQIGVILQDLRDAGVFDDALIILTADHGEELYDHQGFGHGYSLHREVLHVPLWIKRPGQRSGAVVAEDVSLADLLPTVLEEVGIEAPARLDGRSLSRVLRGEQDPRLAERPLLSQVTWPGRMEGASLVSGPWKLIHVDHNYEGLEDVDLLYRRDQDPTESVDLAAREPEVLTRLRTALAASLQTLLPRFPRRDASAALDEDALDALGYGK